ncbi:MAG TPA: proline--tRNA ligase [Chloroflexota bacterium]|nr:proline--tRNA ligase [Chloroflexota bacterium]
MAEDVVTTPEAEETEESRDPYDRLVVRAGLADYSPVRGCMVIREYGYAVWELIQNWIDGELKATGHKNAYFPIFIPLSFIAKEAEHVEGFAPQLAVVTHGGGEELTEPLVVRPTSETIIYDMYRKWIQSYRDLPLLLNQWANVVRWEIRTRPFLRTMEFLWQEGHTAHASAAEADAEARLILDLYIRFIEGELAIPVMSGRKSESEKFAGADITYTMEAMMQDGKALQMGTSHNLGQNFGRAFDVWFLDRDGERKNPWSTSWAVTTRLIGAIVLVHGDAKGLILPPRIAPIQAVIVPIWRDDEQRAAVETYVAGIAADLAAGGIRVEIDDRDTVRPGFKFNEWELKGVPLRLEVGPRDVEAGQAVAARRDTGTKESTPRSELVARSGALLEEIQQQLYARALTFLHENTHEAGSLEDLARGLEEQRGFYRVNWCEGQGCERAFAREKATVRVIPFGEESEPNGPCIVCGEPARARVVVARSY